MEGDPYSPITSLQCRQLAVSGACGVGSYMLEALVRPTRHYHYHYSCPEPPFSIAAAVTFLLMATRVQGQQCMYINAVEAGTRLPVGLRRCKERLRLQTWLPSMFTDVQC